MKGVKIHQNLYFGIIKGVISWWEYNIKICSNEMNTDRKVQIGFLGSKYEPDGGCHDHNNQPFGSMTERVSWQLGGLFTRNDHSPTQGSKPFMNTGLAYPLEFEITLIFWGSESQKLRSAVLTLSTDSFHSSWFSQKYFFSCFLLRRWETEDQFQPTLAVILGLDILFLSKTTFKPLFICICGIFWVIMPLVPVDLETSCIHRTRKAMFI